MTFETAIHLIQTVIMAIGAAALFLVKMGFKGGTVVADYQQLVKRIDEVEDRLSSGGQRLSKLATTVQGWEERARSLFISRAEAALMVDESKNDRHEIRRRLEILEADARRTDRG